MCLGAMSRLSEWSCIMNLKQYFYSSFYYIAYRHRNESGINSEKMWHALSCRRTECLLTRFYLNGRGEHSFL